MVEMDRRVWLRGASATLALAPYAWAEAAKSGLTGQLELPHGRPQRVKDVLAALP